MANGPSYSRRERGGNASHSPAQHRWLVSYADFVTLLFALFVVLFASVQHEKVSLQKVSKSITSGFNSLGAHMEAAPEATLKAAPAQLAIPGQDRPGDGLDDELRSVFGDSIARHEVVLEESSDGLTISLRELGFFASGNAQLLPGAEDPLRRVARVLMQHHLELRVEGHSDDQPIHNATFTSNWELSAARAMTVLMLLVQDAGFDPEKISVAAYGPYRPVASNSTAEGRRTNRRVDLVIIQPNESRHHF